jgi:hypothetical protein
MFGDEVRLVSNRHFANMARVNSGAAQREAREKLLELPAGMISHPRLPNCFALEKSVRCGTTQTSYSRTDTKDERNSTMQSKRYILLVDILALAAAVLHAQPSQTTETQQTPLMDRDKEVALALSACPPFLASKAAVYVLEKAGYVKVR